MSQLQKLIKNNILSSLTLLLALGFIWGTGYSIARFAMTNGVSPLGYSFWQSLGPALIIAMIIYARGEGFKMGALPWHYYFICGLTGIAIPNSVMYFAASHLPAGILAMIVNTVPIIAYPLALLTRLEVFTWQRMTGVIAALIGLMLIMLPQSSLPSPGLTPWVLTTLITPISFAICSIYISRYSTPESNILTQTGGMLLFSSLLLTPLVFATHSFYVFHFPLSLPDRIVLLEIVLSSIGYFLFFQLIRIAGPVYYSLVNTIVVLTGLFWGYVIFDERLNTWTCLAMYFILFALVLVTRQQFNQKMAFDKLVKNE